MTLCNMARRTRRADRPGRARRGDARVAGRGRRARRRHRTPGTATPARRCSRITASTPSTLAPQVAAPHSPANAAPVSRHRRHAHRHRLHRRLHRREARGPAHGGARAAGPARRARRALRGRARLGAATRQPPRREGTLQALLDAGAELLRNACGICAGYGERPPRRERGRDHLDRAQLQGPHGRGVVAGVSRLALHRRRIGGRRPDRDPREISHAPDEAAAAPGCSATTSTPTCSRPGST